MGDMEGLQRRDTILDELHQNILRFIYTYAPGADTYITEEWWLVRGKTKKKTENRSFFFFQILLETIKFKEKLDIRF